MISHSTALYSHGFGSPSTFIERFCLSHPFIQQERFLHTVQLDLLLSPPNPALGQKLNAISVSYQKSRLELSQVLDAASTLAGGYSTQSDLVALSIGSAGKAGDAWCIEHRGALTLSLTKETYQQLGLVGEKRHTKSSEHYVVQLDLHATKTRQFTRARELIRAWDERRRSNGIGPWEVLFQGSNLPFSEEQQPTTVQILPRSIELSDVVVPALDSDFNEAGKSANEETEEDWRERMDDLFEWVGMASMASDRLKANDRANPFIAVYEAPSPNLIGSVRHFRWRGFFGPKSVQRILETVTNESPNPDRHFIAVTASTFANAPLTHISPKVFGEGANDEARLARSNKSVRCWSLVMKPELGEDHRARWILASIESQT